MANEEINYERTTVGLWNRIRERCVIEGCPYTIVPLNLDPLQEIKDRCIWCDEPRKETRCLTSLLKEIGEL